MSTNYVNERMSSYQVLSSYNSKKKSLNTMVVNLRKSRVLGIDSNRDTTIKKPNKYNLFQYVVAFYKYFLSCYLHRKKYITHQCTNDITIYSSKI